MPLSKILARTSRAVFLENRWIIPLTLVLAAIALLVGLVPDLRSYDDTNALPLTHHHLLRAVFFFLPSALLIYIRAGFIARLLISILICVPAAFVWVLYDLDVNHHNATVSYTGEVPVPEAYYLKLILVSLLIISPISLTICHRLTTLLDRYLLRQFTAPFFFCLIAFFAIWLIFDLNDNLLDFGGRETFLKDLTFFYGVQIPFVFTMVAQAALLIAAVYSLSKMSRGNEFIAILGSGRSLLRSLAPLFAFGVYLSFVYLVFSYHWAPWAEGYKESLLDQSEQVNEIDERNTPNRQLFVNEIDNRIWYIGRIPFQLANDKLRVVDIFQQADDQSIQWSLQADSAKWRWQDRTWIFENCTVVMYEDGSKPEREQHAEYKIKGWAETPWELVNTKLEPAYLGVPELMSFLRTEAREERSPSLIHVTNLHYRWAAPWMCLATIFIAAPLGIVYSRRGVLGGVATALFLFGGIMFLTELFLSLGKGGYMNPILAAWLPNLILLVTGSILLYLRARNRSLRFPSLRRRKMEG